MNELKASFYQFNDGVTQYVPVTDSSQITTEYVYYVKELVEEYIDAARNTEHKEKELYKYASVPQVASTTELTDKYVEKFQYQKVNTYKVASEEDKTSGVVLYTKDGDTYTQWLGSPVSGTTYYILEVKETLVSIGFEIDVEEYQDTIYYFPTTKTYSLATEEDLEMYWDFTTYPKENEAPYGCPVVLFYITTESTYREATNSEIVNFESSGIELFYSPMYSLVSDLANFYDHLYQLFIVVPIDCYVPYSRFIPNTTDNYIEGYDKPTGEYPNDYPISLFKVSDFIPSNLENIDSVPYNDITLASIKIPNTVSVNGLDLPFKYDYTLTPCMPYGKLPHLSVSNTVNFGKLHAFNQSGFSTWKYHIDGDQLRLTFGADVYDTYETYKVDGLVLEFYDMWGFSGSLEISDKKAYSGVFTKVIPLNTLKALSNRKIEGVDYIETFAHNVDIEKRSSGYMYNKKAVTFNGRQRGWGYADGTNLAESENDCGTLYSNLLYGVKTYLRRTVEGVK